MKQPFLKVKKTSIVKPNGNPVILKGVNLGGWLLMEGYILHSQNVPACAFKKDFEKNLGKKALDNFEKSFYNSFVQESDIKNIARLKFNCIRVPFHHKLIEKKPFEYDKKGLAYLDKVIAWAEKYKLYVILDLHAAAGCQNHDWHSDSAGDAKLWKSRACQERTFALWKFLANRYKNNSTIAGYDILNEAVIHDTKKLNQFYSKVIEQIRAVDQNHIIFVEGNLWATDINCLERFRDDNLALSIHFYHPIDFIFNFVPQLSYPLVYQGIKWNRSMLLKHIKVYAQKAKKYNAPVLVGEFGINYRLNKYGEVNWLKDLLGCFQTNGFHWTYWTYKAVRNTQFPDGIYSYDNNDPWICRQGPKTGWATYASLWPRNQKEIINSWKTKNFKSNKKIISVLKNAAE